MDRYWSVACQEPGRAAGGCQGSQRSFVFICRSPVLVSPPQPHLRSSGIRLSAASVPHRLGTVVAHRQPLRAPQLAPCPFAGLSPLCQPRWGAGLRGGCRGFVPSPPQMPRPCCSTPNVTVLRGLGRAGCGWTSARAPQARARWSGSGSRQATANPTPRLPFPFPPSGVCARG